MLKDGELGLLEKGVVVKLSSYTNSLPLQNMTVKVIRKQQTNNEAIKTHTYIADYEDGFVTVDREAYFLASSFMFHKLKRNL